MPEEPTGLVVDGDLESRYEELFDRVPVGIYRTTPDGRFLEANAALAEILGLADREELLEAPVAGFYLDPEDRERWKDQIEEADVVRRDDLRLRRPNGRIIRALDVARAVRDAEGRILWYEGMLQDVTERRDAEEALRESEERYRRLVESSPAAILVHVDGKIVYANPTAVRLTRTEGPEDLLGRQVLDMVHPEHRATVAERMRRTQELGEVSPPVEERLLRPDGSELVAEVTALPITYQGRRASQVLIRDVTEARRAEEALRESEQRYRTLFHRTPIAIAEEDFSGVGARLEELREREVEDLRSHLLDHPDEVMRMVGLIEVLDANPAMVALFEAESQEQLLGRHLPETMTEQSFRAYLDQFVAIAEGEDRVEVELAARTVRGRRLHGKLHWMAPRLGDRVDLSRAVVAITDITGLKEVEEALRESEERFRSAFDHASVGMALQDFDGSYLRVNAALCELVGRPEEELLVTSWQEITHPEDRQHGEEQTRRLMAEGTSGFQLEKRYLRPGGETVWAHVSVSLVRDAADRPLSLLVQCVDVTARRRAEQARERLVAILEATTDLVVIVDWEGRLLYANRAARSFFGLGDDEAIPSGLNVEELYADWAYRRLMGAALPAVLEEGSWSGEMAVRTPDGGELPVSLVLIGHWGSDGSVEFFSAIIRDISDRKRAEERLEELVRSKDEFVASVSHELRTPLTAVVGLAQELRDDWDAFAAEEARDLVTVVADQAIEVANIVEDLLVAARADIGRVTVSSSTIDVAEQARHALAVLPAEVRARVEVDAEAAEAWADPSRVRQIVRNLLTNAARYGGERIVMGVRARGERVRVWVEDDGAGIPEGDRERIFEPYYRIGEGHSQPASVGLGLTVSRQLARLMGGDLDYRYRDGRSVFELTLPRP